MRKITWILLFIIIIGICFGCSTNLASIDTRTGQLEIHYIDVGQGDAILIKTPQQGNIMIDGGGDSTENEVIAYLEQERISKLDIVIATHPHEDHIGGLDGIINAFEVGAVYMPNVVHTTKTYENLVTAVKNKGLKANIAKAGVSLLLSEGDVQGIFLAPNSDEYTELNNYSAILQLSYGETRFLFTGDAEAVSELEVVNNYSAKTLNSDVLKVGHHGSSSSSSEEFLRAINPRLAVISVGIDNTYGHPHQEVIQRLDDLSIPYICTSEEGTIIWRSDGEQIMNDKTVRQAEDSFIEKLSEEDIVVELPKIVLEEIDKFAEVVRIVNYDTTVVDLSNWSVVSVKGSQQYVIPTGVLLYPGEELQILSGEQSVLTDNQLYWGSKNIWNNQGDPGELYDGQGRLISTIE